MKLLRNRRKMFDIAFPCSIISFYFGGFFGFHLGLESLEVSSKSTSS